MVSAIELGKILYKLMIPITLSEKPSFKDYLAYEHTQYYKVYTLMLSGTFLSRRIRFDTS